MSAHLPAALASVQDADALLSRAAREEMTVEGGCIRGADLSGTRYVGLRLRGVRLEGCRLTGCRWSVQTLRMWCWTAVSFREAAGGMRFLSGWS